MEITLHSKNNFENANTFLNTFSTCLGAKHHALNFVTLVLNIKSLAWSIHILNTRDQITFLQSLSKHSCYSIGYLIGQRFCLIVLIHIINTCKCLYTFWKNTIMRLIIKETTYYWNPEIENCSKENEIQKYGFLPKANITAQIYTTTVWILTQ